MSNKFQIYVKISRNIINVMDKAYLASKEGEDLSIVRGFYNEAEDGLKYLLNILDLKETEGVIEYFELTLSYCKQYSEHESVVRAYMKAFEENETSE